MSQFELTLERFLFPKGLSNSKANFRFIVDLRFTNDSARFTTEHAVMPSLDTFWECDTHRDKKPNYVRGADEKLKIGTATYNCSQFNMAAIDEWDRLILLVKGQDLHSIQFKVIDVDRKDAWDTVKNFLGGIIEAVIGKIKGVIRKDLALSLSGSLGGAADDLQSFLLKKLAGGNDVLFRGSARLKDRDENRKFNVNGLGTEGYYRIEFSLT